jgi:ligand-binding sensor domain-containing protein
VKRVLDMTTTSIKIFLSILILFVFATTYSQVKIQGTPFIKNYSSVDYKWHPNNYAVVQDSRGVMYFGNAYGILEFDGNTWNQIPLPQGKSAISLTKDGSGRIYVGSVSEVGFLQPDVSGRMAYTSITKLVPTEDRNFEEVWKAYYINNRVIFVSLSTILIYHNNTFRIIKTSDRTMVFDFSGELNGYLYIRESGRGLLRLENETLKIVTGGEYFADKMIYSIFFDNTKKLKTVYALGLAVFDGNVFRPVDAPLYGLIKEYPGSAGIQLSSTLYAIGTIKKGLMLTDEKGQTVQWLNRHNGLLSDCITGLYVDEEDNLWVATDNGISYIHVSSAFTSITENSGIQGMGYAAYVHRQKLYVGTSQGLFVKDWHHANETNGKTSPFTAVKNAEEQVWYINEVDGTLLCGTTRGLAVIQSNEAVYLNPGTYTGGWIFRTFHNNSKLLLGTYYGLELYEKSGSTWIFKNKIKGFHESSRALEIDDDNTIWVCHGNNGLFQITLNEKLDSALYVKNIAVLEGLPLDYFNDLVKIENEIVFASDQCLHTYNKVTQTLEKHETLNKVIGTDNVISKINFQNNGSISLVNKNIIEVLEKKGKDKYVKHTSQFRKLKGNLIGSFEFFWRYDDQNCFIGTQDGFVHFNSLVTKENRPFNIAIRKVESINHKDSLVFAGAPVRCDSTTTLPNICSKDVRIPYSQNALRITYSALYYEDQRENLYQHYLERAGSETNGWTGWTTASYKEYTNLTEGDYIFHVRAKNIYDKISHEATYAFTVLPPWYRTQSAYVGYGIFAVLLLWGIVKLVMLRVRKERRRVETEKQKEIIVLKNEKLEAEVRYKNDELANLATNLSQKTEFLTQLKNELVSINKEVNQGNNVLQLSQLIKSIEKGIDFGDSWDHFQTNFDAVHHNFLHKIRERFPALKSTDLLLCAYIKMNKSNKEMSSLLNISEAAVKKRRFRLREKLKLEDDITLTEFLLDVQTGVVSNA